MTDLSIAVVGSWYGHLLVSPLFLTQSSNMDLIAYVPRLPKLGETIHGDKFQQGFGRVGLDAITLNFHQ